MKIVITPPSPGDGDIWMAYADSLYGERLLTITGSLSVVSAALQRLIRQVMGE